MFAPSPTSTVSEMSRAGPRAKGTATSPSHPSLLALPLARGPPNLPRDELNVLPVPECVCVLSALPGPRSAALRLADAVLLLAAVPSSLVVSAIAALMEERRVAVVASSPAYLSRAVLAIAALLHPFEWPHILVPSLTQELLPVLCAPCPFLVGVTSPMIAEASRTLPPLDDVVFIHLDPLQDLKVQATDAETGDPARRLPRRSRAKLLRRLAKLVSRIPSVPPPPGHAILESAHSFSGLAQFPPIACTRSDLAPSGDAPFAETREISSIDGLDSAASAALFIVGGAVHADSEVCKSDSVDMPMNHPIPVAISKSEPALCPHPTKSALDASDVVACGTSQFENALATPRLDIYAGAPCDADGVPVGAGGMPGVPFSAPVLGSANGRARAMPDDSSGDSSGYRQLQPFPSGPVRRVRSVPISSGHDVRKSLVLPASTMYQADDVPLTVILHRIMSKFYASIVAPKANATDEMPEADSEQTAAQLYFATKQHPIPGMATTGLVSQVFSRREKEHHAFLGVFKNTQLYMQWVDVAAPGLPDFSFGVPVAEPVSSRLLPKRSALRDAVGRSRASRRVPLQQASADVTQALPRASLWPSSAHTGPRAKDFAIASDTEDIDGDGLDKSKDNEADLTGTGMVQHHGKGNSGDVSVEIVGMSDDIRVGAESIATSSVMAIHVDSKESLQWNRKYENHSQDLEGQQNSGQDETCVGDEKCLGVKFESSSMLSADVAQSRATRWLAAAMEPRQSSQAASSDPNTLDGHGKNSNAMIWPSLAYVALKKKSIGGMTSAGWFPAYRAKVSAANEDGAEERNDVDVGIDPMNSDFVGPADEAASHVENSGIGSGTDCDGVDDCPSMLELANSRLWRDADGLNSDGSLHEAKPEDDCLQPELENGVVGWTWASAFQKRGNPVRSHRHIRRRIVYDMGSGNSAEELGGKIGTYSGLEDSSTCVPPAQVTPSETSDMDEFESEMETGDEAYGYDLSSVTLRVVPYSDIDDSDMMQDRVNRPYSLRVSRRRSLHLLARRSNRAAGSRVSGKETLEPVAPMN
jgi:DENN (AEX-3) domain